uniref:Uncharacterized protein n=1 Tax=Oryza brachyantha TaxID=4533 RepID=J3MQG3_ORYBR
MQKVSFSDMEMASSLTMSCIWNSFTFLKCFLSTTCSMHRSISSFRTQRHSLGGLVSVYNSASESSSPNSIPGHAICRAIPRLSDHHTYSTLRYLVS